jgi:nucleotidyltransferase substrate binding protein (TIGR01987 family)
MLDVRWKQRFQNFEKALQLLTEAMQITSPDTTQKAGLIQFFEMSFELAWKTLKDYLEEQGFDAIHSPRGVIKKAFEIELLQDGKLWLELLSDRNVTAHVYDEAMINNVEGLIREQYFPLLKSLHETLKEKLNG